MCGIVVIVDRKPVSVELAKTAVARIKHRGPDQDGWWTSAMRDVFLGQCRLSIVDLSEAGRQPMHNEDETVWLVCNGEIYNYPRLRSELKALDHQFYSHSDSEVVLHAYEEWGDGCVDHLEGMFAFVLWDDRKKRLLAARDRVGIKPLYFHEEGGCLMLASENSALLSMKAFKPEATAFAYVMTLGYVPSPWSVWQGVKKLDPGHILTWADGRVRVKRYWEPPRHIDPEATFDLEEWEALFEEVVRDHLLSDVPIGLFLSGGLDSSSVAACLHDIDQKVQTITVGFPGLEKDETAVARAVAEHLGFPQEVSPLMIEDVMSLIQNVAGAFDEPQGYSALLSMYKISEMAVQNFKVVLAGDGGDEVFGGYNWHRNLDAKLSKSSKLMRNLLGPVVDLLGGSSLRHRVMNDFSKSSILHRHTYRLFPRFLPEEVMGLWAPMDLRFDDGRMLEPLRRHFKPELPLIRALQRVDLMTFCTDSILAKVDKASMAHSLEVRVPFLDRRIIEWALVRPVQPGEAEQGKGLLRKYLGSRVPSAVLEHPKSGFSARGVGESEWDDVLRVIREGIWVRKGYWSKNWEKLIGPGVPFRAARIHVLYMLTCWGNAWVEKAG